MVNSRSCVKHVDVYLERMDTCKREGEESLFSDNWTLLQM